MPYPNEHAARQTEPGGYRSFRRGRPEGFPDGVDAIWGIKPDGTTEIQSIRFDRSKWTPAKAKAWLKDHDFSLGDFTEATAKDVAMPLAKGRLPGKAGKREKADRARCSIVGCTAFAKAKGMCPLHYERMRKGKPVSRSTMVRQADDGFRETVIAKVDQEKHIVYGVVLDPYIVDAHDDWIPPNDVENTAHDWLASSRMMKLQHETPLSAVPVESYVMPYPTEDDYKKAVAGEPHRIYRMKLGTEWVHSGSWVLGTRVLDQAAWDQVTSGELGAYSIGGFGVRREMAKVPMPEVQILTVEAPP